MDGDSDMDVNDRLRKMLEERGLTTYKMAELSGLSHTTLANVFKRNRHLIDNSSLCVCYLKEQSGGTVYTVTYAKAHGLNIHNIAL